MYPNPGQQPIHTISNPNYHQWHKRKVFLLLFKNTIQPSLYANGSTLPTNGRATDDASATTTAPISTAISAAIQQQYPQQHPQYQPYMQQYPEQMIPPQMYESTETRGHNYSCGNSKQWHRQFFELNFKSN